ncbi:MAG TPA: acetolactate synthase large subunit [Chloroflexia bacterium]|nr:acetolactate synthase large subunit [Chloroflexia bacterium]
MTNQEEKVAQPPLNGGQLLFQTARQYGLTHVFGNPGTTEVNFMDALSRAEDFNFFLCLHEDVATGAADGFARISGRPALVNLHLQPGLTHGMANLHNAKRARVPLVVTVGEHHTRFGLEESPLSGDILGSARSLCKWSYTVHQAEEIPAALHRAMLQALTPPQGPVCLVLPNDTLSRITQDNVTIPQLNVPKPGPAHPQAIEESLQLLNRARQPLFVVGDVLTGAGRTALRKLARSVNAQIWLEPFPTRLDPASDPLLAFYGQRLPYFPKQRRQILQNADCILLAGVSGFTTHFLYDDDPILSLVPDNIPVIHLDSDVSELGKNAKSALPLLGDVDLTLLQMLDKQQTTGEAAQEGPAPVVTAEFKPEENAPVTATALGKALRAALPPDTIYVDEAITAGTALNPELLLNNRQLAHILTGRGGSLGYGIPAAIGAKLAAPDKPVLAVIGDGTALYSIQALWTMARYKLPIVTVICNNHNYDIITLEMLRSQGNLAASGPARIMEYTALTPPGINFAALAEGFGVKGWQVTRQTELLPAIEQAFASGAPALLDVSLVSSLRSVQ